MIREFVVKMAVAVREVVSDPRLRRPVIFMISLIWLQVNVLIGTVLPEEAEEFPAPVPMFAGPVPAPVCPCSHFSLFFDRR
ncbi:hypothetical protein J2741_000259 [Methanolinea mesophila]|uniref:hypothetical protein n=1 Tax=Methanolinea mesophila TaxID=547055 RepID=UPI001AE7942D|nr:hypothetical protein [Methanolinea mesophila]MBP1927712.1 hypothetical protein [Methanolinea mesophila]